MARRALVLCLLLAALVTGSPATGASASLAHSLPAATAGESACTPVVPSSADQPLSPSATVGESHRTECFALRPSRADAYAFQLLYEGSWAARIRVLDADGAVVLDRSWFWHDPVPVARLEAGADYRVEVGARGESSSDSPTFRLSVVDLGVGCGSMAATGWTTPPGAVNVAGGRVGCRTVVTSSAAPLRLEATRSNGFEVGFAVVDADGTEVCRDRTIDEGLVIACPTLPAGTYRVVVGTRQRPPATVGLVATTLAATDGCTPAPPGRFGAPLPVTGRRATDGAGQECYRFTAVTTGLHDFRGWQDDWTWAERYEVWDVTTGALLHLTPAWDNSDPEPTTVDLVAGHDYRVLVRGNPVEDVGIGVPTGDARYHLGMVRRTADEGCSAALDTAWSAPAATGRVESGSISCHLLEAAPGSWARIDVRGTQEDTALRVRVIDANGAVVSNARERRTCSAGGGSVTTSNAWSCPLTGPGPYRVLVSGRQQTDRAVYSISVNITSDTAGCRPVTPATWGRAVATEGIRAANGAGVDCWTLTLTERTRYLLDLWVPSSSWRSHGLELYGSTGRPGVEEPPPEEGRRPQANRDRTGALIDAGTYLLVAFGDPGPAAAPYGIAWFDVTGDGSDGGSIDRTCPVLASTSLAGPGVSGRLAQHSQDCRRLPDTKSDVVLLRLESSVRTLDDDQPHGDVGTNAYVFDAAGAWLCNVGTRYVRRCELSGAAPYRVVVSNLPSRQAATYRLWAMDPSDRSGCLPASTAGPGAPPLRVDLAANGASTCVALDDADPELTWALRDADATSVDAVVLDGAGEVACALPDPETDNLHRTCFLDGSPAPHTVWLTNNGTTDRRFDLLLRSHPGDEPGCGTSRIGAAGPSPLVGRTRGALDVGCHRIQLTAGDYYAIDRTNDSGRRPPAVKIYGPDGRLACADSGGEPPERGHTDCEAPSTGRYTVLVIGQRVTAGPYRVDLACEAARCPHDDTVVDLAAGRIASTVRVGQPIRIREATTFPSEAVVSYRWLLDGTVVGRSTTYTPRVRDRGGRLLLETTASMPGRTTTVRTSLVRVVAPGRIALDGRPVTSGTVRAGQVVRASRPIVVEPARGAQVQYRWLRDGRPVVGAVGRSYRVRAVDRGHLLQARVVIRADGYATATVRTARRRAR